MVDCNKLFNEVKKVINLNICVNKYYYLKRIMSYKVNLKTGYLFRNEKFIPFLINQKIKVMSSIIPFIQGPKLNNIQSEHVIGNLFYFVIATLIIAILLLLINSYFSLSVIYLDKSGAFECGFTSFVQTRERFNVIFYRVSLLFLVFDLEIILIFPYTAINQKYQNISKNNVLAFLYILIVGFIYELKEGALNIVKKAHGTEINNFD
jgi:NADH:ubiquinone oxidoreductase subunit 3 (subunit A)